MAKIIGLDMQLGRLKAVTADTVKAEIYRALYAAADRIRVDAAQSITHGAVQGRGHVPSRPGEPPKRDTGQLDTSIVTSGNKADLSVQVTAEAPYAAALEFGTSKIAERPFMRPALARGKDRALAAIEAAVSRATGGT